jgi:hypothetical protein
MVQGQLSKKVVAIRGLNKNHNHDLKNIFKGAAMRAAAAEPTFPEFCAALLATGMKPPTARLTLARKIVAITLLVWKKGMRFDARHLKQQAAGCVWSRTLPSRDSFLAVVWRFFEDALVRE